MRKYIAGGNLTRREQLATMCEKNDFLPPLKQRRRLSSAALLSPRAVPFGPLQKWLVHGMPTQYAENFACAVATIETTGKLGLGENHHNQPHWFRTQNWSELSRTLSDGQTEWSRRIVRCQAVSVLPFDDCDFTLSHRTHNMYTYFYDTQTMCSVVALFEGWCVSFLFVLYDDVYVSRPMSV